MLLITKNLAQTLKIRRLSMSNLSIFDFNQNKVRVVSKDPLNPLHVAYDVATSMLKVRLLTLAEVVEREGKRIKYLTELRVNNCLKGGLK